MRTYIYYIGIALLACVAEGWAREVPEGRVAIDGAELRATDDSIHVRMRIDLSDLELSANRSVMLWPWLRIEADSTRLPGVAVMGRRQYIYAQRNAEAVPAGTRVTCRVNGTPQRVDYVAAVPVAKRPGRVRLYVDEDSCGCERRVLASAERLVAERDFTPVVFTPRLAYIQPEAETRKARDERGMAFLDFPVNTSTIRADYRGNAAELAKIARTIDRVRADKDMTITRIAVKGHASPEGSYASNRRLAEARPRALIDYLRALYDFDAALFALDYEAEDWAGLRAFIDGSDWAEREALLAICDSDASPDEKERQLRARHPAAYRRLVAECFPALRHSDYTVEYTVRGFDVAEARQVIWTDPSKLSLQEMYAVAQTYEVGGKEYNAVFEAAVRVYPTDSVANLNAAVAALTRGDIRTAEVYLERAGDSGEASLARGALAYAQGDPRAAERFFLRAKEQGAPYAEENLERLRRTMESEKL